MIFLASTKILPQKSIYQTDFEPSSSDENWTTFKNMVLYDYYPNKASVSIQSLESLLLSNFLLLTTQEVRNPSVDSNIKCLKNQTKIKLKIHLINSLILNQKRPVLFVRIKTLPKQASGQSARRQYKNITAKPARNTSAHHPCPTRPIPPK